MSISSSTGRRFLVGGVAIVAGLLASREAAAQVDAAEYHGQSGGSFGKAIANAGDVDGDGIDDLLVGERNYTPSSSLGYAGRVSVYSGATHALIRTHDGAAGFDALGWGVSGAGDVNLDGYADYAVCAPYADSNGTLDTGLVVVYSGVDGSALWTVYGATAYENLGYAVAGIGDVNGDGKADVLASKTNLGSWNGKVTAYDDTGSVIYTIIENRAWLFGIAVAACGDLDGDGVRDFVVGEPNYDSITPARARCGRVIAYSAATGTELFNFIGANAYDQLGYAVGTLGDVDGDQIPDLLAGGAYSLANGGDSGVMVVASGATGAAIRTTYGANAGDHFGASVAGMGDINRDGIDDYLVGAPDAGSGKLGLVQALSGADGSLVWEMFGTSITGVSSNIDLGAAVAGGDFNGDGVADFVAGDPNFNDTIGGFVGSVILSLGCPAWWQNYGAGWPGTNGIPNLVALNDPQVGSSISVQLDNSRGKTTAAVVLVGTTQASIPTSAGGTLLLDTTMTVPFIVPVGGLTIDADLPDDPALYFTDLFVQALEFDPGATKRISFTPGLQLHLGYDLP